MPKDRDRDEERDDEPEDDEDRRDDEQDDEPDGDAPVDDEADEEADDEDDEPPPRARPSRDERASSRKKRAEQRRVADEPDDEEPRPREARRSAGGATRDAEAASSSSAASQRRRRERDESREARRGAASKKPAARGRAEDEGAQRRSKGAAAPARKRRDQEKIDLSAEIVEPDRVPDAEIDLGAELDPTWEPGVMIGGGLGLVGVAFAVVSLLTSGGAVSTISVIGLVILLMAIAAGGIGVLARKAWGYVLGVGAGGLGVVAGLLWSLYTVVGSDMSPLWPLFFFLCSLGSVIFLFQMRWGPGPMADERERLRSLKLRTANYTTVSGELALSGSIAAVLASVLAGLLLMGATAGERATSNAAAQFVDGMDLEAVTEPPETGTLVLARWGNEDYFFLGRVEQVRNGEELNVAYLDGDRAWVRMTDVRRDTLRAGASVHIHVQGHDGWLPAVVTQRSGNRLEADVGSQRVWVPLGMVRVREAS